MNLPSEKDSSSKSNMTCHKEMKDSASCYTSKDSVFLIIFLYFIICKVGLKFGNHNYYYFLFF